ncbi:hypothetical protein Amsp01_064690 [Amycolatopsis sp. NBRC 101858]|nr:hypothetical protein Amsp01_064690 [Amycolatopsis sp. NBRC 101858]
MAVPRGRRTTPLSRPGGGVAGAFPAHLEVVTPAEPFQVRGENVLKPRQPVEVVRLDAHHQGVRSGPQGAGTPAEGDLSFVPGVLHLHHLGTRLPVPAVQVRRLPAHGFGVPAQLGEEPFGA